MNGQKRVGKKMLKYLQTGLLEESSACVVEIWLQSGHYFLVKYMIDGDKVDQNAF